MAVIKNKINPVLKRAIDISGALGGLLFIIPFTPLIWIAIKLESRGPALVRLERISGGKVIKVYKFRSMINGARKMKKELKHLNERTDGPFFKIKNDPRLTKTGKVLRKFRIDEFPQLINVLTGDLSLVGPRPHEPEEIIFYPQNYKYLILAKSGVTGLSQVSGASGLPFLKELSLDAEYQKKQSFIFDLKIILKTLMIIFSDPNAV